jgi:hypothetical protein
VTEQTEFEMAYTDKGKFINEAAKAHTDLNVFAGIVALLEGGLVSSECQTTEFRIIEICKREQAKCLARYDRAVAKAGGGTYGR